MLGCAFSAMAQGGYQDGVDYYNASRLEEAKIILDNTLNDSSTDKAVSYFYLGCIDLQKGNAAAARANFEKGLAANPNDPFNKVGLGEIALRDGDKKTAETQFKDAEKAADKDASVYAAIARAYYNVDATAYSKEIQKNIDKGFKKSKYSEPAIYMLQGDMLAGVNPGEAAGLYETAMRMAEERGDRVNPEAYVKYANTYFRINPTYAIDRLKELNEKLPTSALAQRELAEKYYENEQLTMAAEQYSKYMNNPNHFQRDEQRYAGLLYFGKRYEESLKVAEKVIAQDPENFYMWRMKMYDLVDLKRYDEAVAAGEKLFSIPGADLNYKDYDMYGDALIEIKGRAQDAVSAYEKALQLNPQRTELLSKISEAYTAAEQYMKAAEMQQRYVDAGNTKTQDLYILARRYFNAALSPEHSEDSPLKVENANLGIGAIDQAIQKAPDQGTLYRTKAQLLQVAQGKVTAEAAQCYEKMVELYTADPAEAAQRKSALIAAYGVLGNYYIENGDKQTGRSYFEKYLELDPENTDISNYLKNLK